MKQKVSEDSAFIYVSQGRTARFIKGESDVGILKGLCTAQFYNCNILILISADKLKISLTHADVGMDRGFVNEEIEWLGTDCEKFVFIRDNKEALEDFKKIFSTSRFNRELKKTTITNSEVYALSILDAVVRFHTEIDYKKMTILQYPIARISCLRNFNILHDAFARSIEDENSLKFTRLIFDVNSWEPARENDINPSASLHKVLSIDGALAHGNSSCPQIDRIKQALQIASKDKSYYHDLFDDDYIKLFEMNLRIFIEEVIRTNNTQYVDHINTLLLANKRAKTFVHQDKKQLFKVFQNKKLSDYEKQFELLLKNFLDKMQPIEQKDRLIFVISHNNMLGKHKKNLKELEECYQVQAATRMQSLFRGNKSRILFTKFKTVEKEFKEVEQQYEIAKLKYNTIRHKLLGS